MLVESALHGDGLKSSARKRFSEGPWEGSSLNAWEWLLLTCQPQIDRITLKIWLKRILLPQWQMQIKICRLKAPRG
jgi:hypothetical protein